MRRLQDHVDVTVIGCGPAGLIAARESAKNNVSVITFEEHDEIGLPCHCAGLISIDGLAKLGVPLDSSIILNKLKGAHFHSPSGLSFKVERKKNVACVIDRIKLDRFLANQAIDVGVRLNLGQKVSRIKRHADSLWVEGQWGRIDSSIVIDAGGVGSKISKQMGLVSLDYEYVLPALQFELTDVDIDESYAEIYLGQKIAPNFFAWIIPLNDRSVRIGLATNGGNLVNILENFTKARFEEFSLVSTSSGQIITCGPIKETFTDNFVVVGDAAGQVKPTTGGGVVLGGLCASIAGEISALTVKNATPNRKHLRAYEQSWKKKLGREFTIMRMVRQIINLLTDETIDRLFRIIIDKNYQQDFSLFGDMDFQASLLLALTKKKDLMSTIFKITPHFIIQEIKKILKRD